MHVGFYAPVALPDGCEKLDVGELRARIAGKIHLLPKFRKQLTAAPLGAEPSWEDDPNFRLTRHVNELPVTFAGLGLSGLTDAFFSKPLRRDRPLWEIVVVPRTEPGQAVVLGKVHHAMVDGVGAVELGMLMFDVDPDAVIEPPVPWNPAPPATRSKIVLGALSDMAAAHARATGATFALARSPRRATSAALAIARTAASTANDLARPVPTSYLNPDIGPERTLMTHRIDIGRMLEVKRRAGITLNDAVLAVCAGALRRFALRCGEPPDDLRVLIPVSTRRNGHERATGNQITFVFIELPVSAEDPEERLRLVVERTRRLKGDGRIQGSSAVIAGLDLVPGPARDVLARLSAAPQLFNLVISNVPGPRVPIYVAGSRVEAIHPVIPNVDRHALSIGVVSYGGGLNFGCYADPKALQSVGELAPALEDAMAELERVTEPRRTPAPHRPRTHRSGPRPASTPYGAAR
jgi:WS/DGAT/MGAT family acyltransferase